MPDHAVREETLRVIADLDAVCDYVLERTRRDLPRRFPWGDGKTDIIARPAERFNTSGNATELVIFLTSPASDPDPSFLEYYLPRIRTSDLVLIDFKLVRIPGGGTEIYARCHEECMQPYFDELIASIKEPATNQSLTLAAEEMETTPLVSDKPPFIKDGKYRRLPEWATLFEWYRDWEIKQGLIAEPGKLLSDHWSSILEDKTGFSQRHLRRRYLDWESHINSQGGRIGA